VANAIRRREYAQDEDSDSRPVRKARERRKKEKRDESDD
jgi:hypothetical protein